MDRSREGRERPSRECSWGQEASSGKTEIKKREKRRRKRRACLMYGLTGSLPPHLELLLCSVRQLWRRTDRKQLKVWSH